MEPFPLINTRHPVEASTRFNELPRGPNSLPTKLNYIQKMIITLSTFWWLFILEIVSPKSKNSKLLKDRNKRTSTSSHLDICQQVCLSASLSSQHMNLDFQLLIPSLWSFHLVHLTTVGQGTWNNISNWDERHMKNYRSMMLQNEKVIKKI